MKLTPLFKQVGGKRKLAPQIADRLAPMLKASSTYHEPFAGGAAVFCELHNRGLLDGRHVVLGDVNADLVEVYRSIQKSATTLLSNLAYLATRYARGPKYAEELYYESRTLWNEGKRSPSRFLFLKATSFNGLWRVNQKGELNASWGKYASPKLPDAALIHAWHAALEDVHLHAGDYRLSPWPVTEGDVVYVDPPYDGTFTGYHEDGFDYAAQVRLLGWLYGLREIGVSVAYSNASTGNVDRLLDLFWPTGTKHVLETAYVVNTDGAGRSQKAKEVFVEEGAP